MGMNAWVLLLGIALWAGQAGAVFSDEDGDTATTDERGGFSTPKVDEAVVDAISDFERHLDNRAWEKAFAAMREAADGPPDRLVPTSDGFYIPIVRRIWSTLVGMPAEARDAFRLFHDANARQLLGKIAPANVGTDQERDVLQSIFDRYFISSVGVEAADRLGDLHFECGRFNQARRVWQAIDAHHDLDDAPACRLRTKRTIALFRDGQIREARRLLDEINRLHGKQSITLGGKKVQAADWLDALLGETRAASGDKTGPPAVAAPADGTEPRWRLRFMSATAVQNMQAAMGNWWGPTSGLTGHVPRYVIDGQRLFCNWFGIVFSVNLQTGKLLRRTAKFDVLNEKLKNIRAFGQLGNYAIVHGGDCLLVLAIDPERLNHWQEPYRLFAYDADTLALRWSSQKIESFKETGFLGRPLILDDQNAAIVSHPKNSSELTLRVLSMADGGENWSLPIGHAQMSTTMHGQQVLPIPLMVRSSNTLYLLTNNGALLAIDLLERRIVWAFKCETPVGAGQQQQHVRRWNRGPNDRGNLYTDGVLRHDGGILYFKETRGRMAYALDPAACEVLWKRRAGQWAKIVDLDAHAMYLLADELEAIDRSSRDMRWSTRLPIGTGGVNALHDDEKLVIFTRRGLYEVDKVSGDVNRIFRGHDLDSRGGSLELAKDQIIAISNLAITAYALNREEEAQP